MCVARNLEFGEYRLHTALQIPAALGVDASLQVFDLAQARPVHVLLRLIVILLDEPGQMGQPAADIRLRGQLQLVRQRLRELADAQVHAVPDVAGIGLLLAGDEPQKCRFARAVAADQAHTCLLYTSPSPRDGLLSRMP